MTARGHDGTEVDSLYILQVTLLCVGLTIKLFTQTKSLFPLKYLKVFGSKVIPKLSIRSF